MKETVQELVEDWAPILLGIVAICALNWMG